MTPVFSETAFHVTILFNCKLYNLKEYHKPFQLLTSHYAPFKISNMVVGQSMPQINTMPGKQQRTYDTEA
jgi:hypothetical protein